MLGGINNTLFFTSFAGFAVMGLFIILLKWAFSRGSSLVEKPKKIGDEDEYGLLKVVASPANFIEGEMLRLKLDKHGIKATLTQTKSGPKVLVFEKEISVAQAILRS
jgi:hypothetical protein